ncbi:MAG: radical SAM protein [Acidobacteriota bacterium]
MTRPNGYPIVLSAPLTEIVDNPGFFIQMGLASLPGWMEWAITRTYPRWREVPVEPGGTAGVAPCGLRTLENVLGKTFGTDNVAVCYPDGLGAFIGPDTRVVAISTHNPLGTTFAAGVYASIFGSSKDPINAVYARRMFENVKASPHRESFRVIVGGSGAWQIQETSSLDDLGVDCVVEGRSESPEVLDVFRKALAGEPIPREIRGTHPIDPDAIAVPVKRTTFGVIEMTTGCGRRCAFCAPDNSPRIDVPKEKIMAAVKANVEAGNDQISLATEDMFIWGSGRACFVPNREALIDIHSSIAGYPGVRHVLLSHGTMAPVVVDPALIRELSDILLDKSPLELPQVSTHPRGRVLSPLIGIETGSPRLAKKLMPGKALPFDISEWPSVVIEGLTILNRNNWIPVMTLIVGSPEETGEDIEATLDLLYEMERRSLKALLVPSIFTPLRDTRMRNRRGITRTRGISQLQWQLIMKSWQMSARIGLQTGWVRTAWPLGSYLFWALQGRRANGPNFTWPLFLFAGFPEALLRKLGGLYRGVPLQLKHRDELFATGNHTMR